MKYPARKKVKAIDERFAVRQFAITNWEVAHLDGTCVEVVQSTTLKKGKTFLKIEKVIKVGETFEWDWENTLWKAAVLASFEDERRAQDIAVRLNRAFKEENLSFFSKEGPEEAYKKLKEILKPTVSFAGSTKRKASSERGTSELCIENVVVKTPSRSPQPAPKKIKLENSVPQVAGTTTTTATTPEVNPLDARTGTSEQDLLERIKIFAHLLEGRPVSTSFIHPMQR
ncbi:hypothetical protein ACHWQZ_G000183 [Mnemiopsis leidyi]